MLCYMLAVELLNFHKKMFIEYADVRAFLYSSDNKRRSRYVQNTSEPEWHQTLVFMNLTRQQLVSQTLELTVWDYDRFKTHEFLGEVSLNMSGKRCALYSGATSSTTVVSVDTIRHSFVLAYATATDRFFGIPIEMQMLNC